MCENAIVEESGGRNIAARGRDEQQQAQWLRRAAIRQDGQEILWITFAAMVRGAGMVAQFRERRAQSLMRLRMIGIEPKRGFEMRPRRRCIAVAEKQIGEVDVALGVIRVAAHRAFVDGAGGLRKPVATSSAAKSLRAPKWSGARLRTSR